jgi:hypothetical protein
MTSRHLSAVLSLLLAGFPAAAATIRVHVERGAYRGPLELKLGVARDDEAPRWITTRTLAPRANGVVFESLERGSYVVLAKGSGPLQQLAGKAVVGATDEREIALEIPKRKARGRVTLAGKPVGAVGVNFENTQWHWTAFVEADANGAFSADIWESGEFELGLRGGALPAPVFRKVRVPAGEVAQLDIDLPARSVRGKVLDAARNRPVAGAVVVVRNRTPGKVTSLRRVSAADGTFEFAGLESGSYRLEMAAPELLLPDDVAFELRDSDTLFEHEFRLVPGELRVVEVVDSKNAPVAGAVVTCIAGERTYSMTKTDPHGRAFVATPAGERSQAWVAPVTGSFAMASFDRPDENGEATKIVVPAPNASLQVETMTTTGAALPHVRLLMRYNGTLVPASFATFLVKQDIQLATNENGVANLARIPPGVYEFWPYRSDEESQQLAASASFAAPINVNVLTGENRVTVRLRKLR